MDYLLWFVDLENYKTGDEIYKMVETLLDLKEDGKLRARVNKERVFAFIVIKNSHPNIFQLLKARIIVFPFRWIVESSFLAVLDVFN